MPQIEIINETGNEANSVSFTDTNVNAKFANENLSWEERSKRAILKVKQYANCWLAPMTNEQQFLMNTNP